MGKHLTNQRDRLNRIRKEIEEVWDNVKDHKASNDIHWVLIYLEKAIEALRRDHDKT